MLDRLGIIGSAICAAHCTLPILLSFISPSVASIFGSEGIHYALLMTVIPLAIFSFLKTRSVHRSSAPLVFGIVGILILIAAVKLEQPFESLFQNFEVLATVLGSSILILSHFMNLKLISRSKLINL